MTAEWKRLGDAWVNHAHIELVHVLEEEGRWHAVAEFVSGRTFVLRSHDDREVLTEVFDALLCGEASRRGEPSGRG